MNARAAYLDAAYASEVQRIAEEGLAQSRAHLAQVSPTGLPTQEPVERKPTDGLAAKFGGYTMWRLPQYYLQRTRAVVGRRVAALRGGS